jgi:hypothetical protein
MASAWGKMMTARAYRAIVAKSTLYVSFKERGESFVLIAPSYLLLTPW